MRFGARGQATPLRRVWVWLVLDKYIYKYNLFLNKRTVLSYLVCRLELLDGCCVAIFASVLSDASAIFWCERGRILAAAYLLAFLHSLSAARLSLPGSPLGVRWETAAFGLPLVWSWLVENTDADSWFEILSACYIYI